jgi:3-isopropylmalate/(R)-2-methylmalate dehydratase small subunit
MVVPINLGLPVMIAPDAAAGLEAGRDAELSVASNMIGQGAATWTAQPLDGEVAAFSPVAG